MSRVLSWWMTRLQRFFGYFSVLRPSYAFGLLVVVLPLAAFFDQLGKSMVGNLFADYLFWPALWFGTTLFGGVWALMFITGLSLDTERDRKDRWVHDPGEAERWVTLPVQRNFIFVLFTLMAAPGFVSVVWHATDPRAVAIGIVLGGLLIFAGIDLAISFLRLADPKLQILPWPPVLHRLAVRRCSARLLAILAAPARIFAATTTSLARAAALPEYFFETDERKRLRADHIFAAWTSLFLLVVWLFLYVALRPGGFLHARLDALPPAGFLYLLAILLLFIVSLVWIRFRRYRLTFVVLALWAIAVNWLQSAGGVEGSWWRGHPVHSYDVYRLAEGERELTADDVLAPLAEGPRASDHGRTLIVAAASGGGILAAGWTTKVLGEIQCAYPPLRRELRLISAVSGGSVGAVHYVGKHDGSPEPLPVEVLRRVLQNSVETSLTAAAYGFAFPDFHRLFLPLGVPELDRARLQEARWQDAADGTAGNGSRRVDLLSAWNKDIRDGRKPAVILNTTVLESGERIAITPLVSLRQVNGADTSADWEGWKILRDSKREPVPNRRNGARTLSEFLLPEARMQAPGYTIDVWTAARLSATFSYVSPPAQARLVCRTEDQGCSQDELSKRFAPLHLIDGGYHENYGVASALDWLTRAVRSCEAKGNCPFTRVAFLEIRAKPESVIETSEKEWLAAWLGPAVGLLSSWAFAQTTANDASVDRLIRRMQAIHVPFESFVFVPQARKDGFPLSWHLSDQQKEKIHEYWRDEPNQRTLRAFLRFANCGNAEEACPAADAALGDGGRPFEKLAPYLPN